MKWKLVSKGDLDEIYRKNSVLYSSSLIELSESRLACSSVAIIFLSLRCTSPPPFDGEQRLGRYRKGETIIV